MTSEPEPPAAPPSLPPRDPHPFAMHVAIDAAVSFLVIVLIGLMWNLSIAIIVAVALIAGICLAPWTHRIEVRQLATRRAAAEAAGATERRAATDPDGST
ncbi:MAG: hypothetical protein ABWY77_00225 [Acidimicrobiia bacterium]